MTQFRNHMPPAERNREPIRVELARILGEQAKIAEIGSYSGQHAIYMCQHHNWHWQPMDQQVVLADLEANLQDFATNLCADAHIATPIAIDLVDRQEINVNQKFDAVLCANVAHCVGRESMRNFWHIVQQLAPTYVFLYGPYKYNGEFTTPSNAEFDIWLRNRYPAGDGILDIEWMIDVANRNQFELLQDIAMPANNQLLVFKR